MSKQQTLEREARIAPMVGAAGFGGALLFAISLFATGGSEVSKADTVAGQLLAFNDDSAQFVIAQSLQALGLLLLGFVMVTLFRAAQARSDDVYGGMLGFAAIGPALYAISIVLTLSGFSSASRDYADLPQPQVGGAAEVTKLKSAIADNPDSITKMLLLTDPDVVEYKSNDAITSAKYSDDEEQDLESSAKDAGIDVDTDDKGEAGELAAREVIADNSVYSTSRLLLLPATLALIIITFYTARIALRTGLQTQFWGTFGMAAGVATLLLGPIGPFIWAVNAGLVSSGWNAARRPPAWAAGEAIAWTRLGAEPPSEEGEEAAQPEDFEGSATELPSDRERPGRRDNKKKRKRKQRG